MTISHAQLRRWLADAASTGDLAALIRRSKSTPYVLAQLRATAPDLATLPALTYTGYRTFEQIGERRSHESKYMMRRAMLTRAVLELILGNEPEEMRDRIHDLMWAICEETSWVFPAHEEQGPDYWDLDPPAKRAYALGGPDTGAHTMLTREPDSIDLFCAETGASLSEAVHLVGRHLSSEVVLRVKHEVERRIFRPYLHFGRRHWWFKGALNWNGVCNGAISLAFLRLEKDPDVLAQALSMALEGFEAYIATGFEADGGSIEGVGYWNYGLIYYTAVSELLREITRGELDLLSGERMRRIAAYPPTMQLSTGRYVNNGDAEEYTGLTPGTTQRIARRTGVRALRVDEGGLDQFNVNSCHKLAIMLRNAAWWDGTFAPAQRPKDAVLPDVGVVKHVGETAGGKPVVLAAKAGHNDGHHSHCDVAHFIVHVGDESLLCDPGRGLYSKEYFRRQRYDNVFNSARGHSVPVIGGKLQAPGPEFGGRKQFHGQIIARGTRRGMKFAEIAFQAAYDLPELERATRTLALDPRTGEVTLDDAFAFAGSPLEIEEAFFTWFDASADGPVARIAGARSSAELRILAPEGAVFSVESLDDECRANKKPGVLKRITSRLPAGAARFTLRITPT